LLINSQNISHLDIQTLHVLVINLIWNYGGKEFIPNTFLPNADIQTTKKKPKPSQNPKPTQQSKSVIPASHLHVKGILKWIFFVHDEC